MTIAATPTYYDGDIAGLLSLGRVGPQPIDQDILDMEAEWTRIRTQANAPVEDRNISAEIGAIMSLESSLAVKIKAIGDRRLLAPHERAIPKLAYRLAQKKTLVLDLATKEIEDVLDECRTVPQTSNDATVPPHREVRENANDRKSKADRIIRSMLSAPMHYGDGRIL